MKKPIIKTKPLRRWHFREADCERFQKQMDNDFIWREPKPENNGHIVKLTISVAKKHILRGFRQIYIPCWNEYYKQLYQKFQENKAQAGADLL